MPSIFRRSLFLIPSDPATLLRRSARATSGILIALTLLVFAGITNSQAASITTLFSSNNGGDLGGAVYFDLTVGPNDITITGIDTNTSEVGVFAGFEIYTKIGNSFGNETNGGLWSLAATGTLSALGLDFMSSVALASNVVLSASTLYGLALVMPAQAGHDYTISGQNGALQKYMNADLTLNFGTATNAPFTGGTFQPFTPRTWNGTINYTTQVAVIPLPAAFPLFATALAGMGLLGWRRKRKAAA